MKVKGDKSILENVNKNTIGNPIEKIVIGKNQAFNIEENKSGKSQMVVDEQQIKLPSLKEGLCWMIMMIVVHTYKTSHSWRFCIAVGHTLSDCGNNLRGTNMDGSNTSYDSGYSE